MYEDGGENKVNKAAGNNIWSGRRRCQERWSVRQREGGKRGAAPPACCLVWKPLTDRFLSMERANLWH